MTNRIAPLLRPVLARRAIALPARRGFADKPLNPASQFYKTFTRPIAKVLLLAVFTYQLAYWSWVKLETDEIRADTDTTIADLEGKVEEYKKKIAAEVKDKKST